MSAQVATKPGQSTGPVPGSGSFADRVLDAGLLWRTGVDGVYGRSGAFEAIIDALHRRITALGMNRFEEVHFPPIADRSLLVRTGYVRSFTDLIGSVDVYSASEHDHLEFLRRHEDGEDWAGLLQPAEVMLASAACHPLYATCSGRLPAGGRRFDVRGFCFRHEPSTDIARMQSFRMHELVHVGEPADALAHREAGLAQGLEMLSDLGLELDAVVANDPFFGRTSAILADGQRHDAAKLEGVTLVGEVPTAVMSANYARDHFGTAFSITADSGTVAHSACVAFGVDRIALALLSRHGFAMSRWPRTVARRLWP